MSSNPTPESNTIGYPCSCGKIFASAFDCINHQKAEHGIQFQCFTCFVQFENGEDLKRHLAKMNHFRQPASGGDDKASKRAEKNHVKQKHELSAKSMKKPMSTTGSKKYTNKYIPGKWSSDDNDSDAENTQYIKSGGHHHRHHRDSSKKRKVEASPVRDTASASSFATDKDMKHNPRVSEELYESGHAAKKNPNNDNQHLLAKIADLEDKVDHYRTRARSAEAELSDLEDRYVSKKEFYEGEIAKLKATNTGLLAIIGKNM